MISIDTVFNVVNLAVRIVIALFLVRKYVVHKIQASLRQEHIDHVALDQRYQDIEKSCESVQHTILQQEQLYAELQEKFKAWQTAVAVQEQKDNVYLRQQEQVIHMKQEQKRQYMLHKIIVQKEFPDVLRETTNQLQQDFKTDKQRGKAYLRTLMQSLNLD
ncbi:hypothetical protein KBD08_00295 [Candidatus Babeliales bacterium]|nr:hypothetical protein [Candidatus Babeliales bacterium]